MNMPPVILYVDEFGPVWSDGKRRTKEQAAELFDAQNELWRCEAYRLSCACGETHKDEQ